MRIPHKPWIDYWKIESYYHLIDGFYDLDDVWLQQIQMECTNSSMMRESWKIGLNWEIMMRFSSIMNYGMEW